MKKVTLQGHSDIETPQERKPFFRTKVTLLCTVIGTVAAIFMARTDAWGVAHWVMSQIDAPATQEKMQSDIADIKESMEKREGLAEIQARSIDQIKDSNKSLEQKLDALNDRFERYIIFRTPRAETLATNYYDEGSSVTR